MRDTHTPPDAIKPSDYGYCPICGAECLRRERRLNGNDTCKNGHVYPSREAVHKPQ